MNANIFPLRHIPKQDMCTGHGSHLQKFVSQSWEKVGLNEEDAALTPGPN